MSTNTTQTSDYWSCPTTSVFSGLLMLDLSLSVQARCYDAMDDGSRYSDSHKYCGFPLGWLLELSCHLLPTLSSLTWCAMAWECSIGLPWGESFPCRKQMAPSRILCPGSYFTAHPRATWEQELWPSFVLAHSCEPKLLAGISLPSQAPVSSAWDSCPSLCTAAGSQFLGHAKGPFLFPTFPSSSPPGDDVLVFFSCRFPGSATTKILRRKN